MIGSMLTNETKSHVVIVALKARHGDLEISCFLKVLGSFVHKTWCEFEKEDGRILSVLKNKKHYKCSDSSRTPEFI